MKQLIYILSEPRSGSTALEYVLSTHPRVLALGEVKLLENFIRNDPRFSISQCRCTCGALLTKCNFWATIIREACEIIGCKPEQIRSNYAEKDQPSTLGHPEVQKHLNALLNLIASKEDKIIIDSSKSLNHLKILRKAIPDWDIKVIYLSRNPLEVTKSKSKWKSRKKSFLSPRAYLLYKWTASNRKMRQHLKGIATNDWIEIRYEDFTQDPEAHLERVSRMVGVENNFSTTCNLRQLHTVAGTPTRFTQDQFVLSRKPMKNAQGKEHFINHIASRIAQKIVDL